MVGLIVLDHDRSGLTIESADLPGLIELFKQANAQFNIAEVQFLPTSSNSHVALFLTISAGPLCLFGSDTSLWPNSRDQRVNNSGSSAQMGRRVCSKREGDRKTSC